MYGHVTSAGTSKRYPLRAAFSAKSLQTVGKIGWCNLAKFFFGHRVRQQNFAIFCCRRELRRSMEEDDPCHCYSGPPISAKTFEGSFSAVWVPTIARVGAFFHIFRDLQDSHSFAPLHTQIFVNFSFLFLQFFPPNFIIFCEFWINFTCFRADFDENLSEFHGIEKCFTKFRRNLKFWRTSQHHRGRPRWRKAPRNVWSPNFMNRKPFVIRCLMKKIKLHVRKYFATTTLRPPPAPFVSPLYVTKNRLRSERYRCMWCKTLSTNND